jgi:beta-ureidopropionase / N-carbamoyl-L-amino-acid hydrolase
VSLGERLAELEGIGRDADGTHRFAWTEADRQTRDWFERQARRAGLKVERDAAGNLWACPDAPEPWWGIGSHLDSVRGGGLFDGPLGVACAFEVAERCDLPIAVISFADEEGARFNSPTFGSKALTGVLDVPTTLARQDDQGITLADAMRADGLDPNRLASAGEWLPRLRGFVELHIDQTTEVADAGSPLGIVSSLASRMRLEAHLSGRADHAGTTPQHQRRDAMSAAAHLIVGAEQLSDELGELTVTSSRILVAPNAVTTVAADVRLSIDARSADPERPERWRQALVQAAASLADRTGVEIEITLASQSGATRFSAAICDQLHADAARLLGHEVPSTVCFAGHDAGLLAARMPAAMVLVRNRSGISHSPLEHVELDDAELATTVIEHTLTSMIAEVPGR